MRQSMLDAIEKMYQKMFTPAEERLKVAEACLAEARDEIAMLRMKINDLEEHAVVPDFVSEAVRAREQ